jgi:hypothetical protein
LTTPAVCHRDHSFFTELRKAHISCPVPEGDAPNGIKLWAYDQFKASKLSLDAVWQIDRASSPAAESDKKIISSMLLSLMHGDGNEMLRESEIRRGDRIWSSLEAIAKSENDNRFSDKEIISITIKDVIKFLRIE